VVGRFLEGVNLALYMSKWMWNVSGIRIRVSFANCKKICQNGEMEKLLLGRDIRNLDTMQMQQTHAARWYVAINSPSSSIATLITISFGDSSYR
jgi:hypothetical protein